MVLCTQFKKIQVLEASLQEQKLEVRNNGYSYRK
jgi:hypothetical protein